MTRYTVTWVSHARDELAQLWMDSSDRNTVSNAANLIDRELCENASNKGRELKEGLRSLFSPPIKVIFAVREDDRIVEVERVLSL